MPLPSPAVLHPRDGWRKALVTVLVPLLAALLLIPGRAVAQWTGAVGVVSDYRHRGVSFSDRRPAAQASMAWDHPSGLFVGAQATTVRLGPATVGTNVEFLYYGGFARDVGPFTWEVGLLRYDYSGPTRVQNYGYAEAFVGASRGGLTARLFRSNRHYEYGEGSWYGQAMYAGAITDDLQYFAQAGVLRLARDRAYAGATVEHHVDVRFGLQTLWRGFQFEVGIVGTDRPDSACYGAERRCGFGPVVSISRPLP
jgi:uncharacterized protein (TIGR02001 family)